MEETPQQVPVPNPVSEPVVPENPPPKSLRINKKFFAIGGVLLILIAISAVLLLRTNIVPPVNEKEKLVSVEENELIATVGNTKQIFVKDARMAVEEQYVKTAVTPELIKQFAGNLIQQTIIDMDAEQLGLVVSEQEIEALVTNKDSAVEKKIARYNLLKEKIMAKQVKNVEANTIGFWVPPFADPQLPEFAVQRADGEKALAEGETRLRNNEVPLVVAKDLFAKYPSLKQIFAFNGYIMDGFTDIDNFSQPKIYTFGEQELKDLNDPDFYNALVVMGPGEVKQAVRQDGSGRVLMQVVSVKREGPVTFNEYMDQRILEEVVYSSNKWL